MIPKQEFFKIAADQISDDSAEVLLSKSFGSGYFVCIEKECAIVDEEFDDLARLPNFITDLDSFYNLELFINSSYSNGFKQGQKELRENINFLIGGINKTEIKLDDIRFYSEEERNFLRLFEKNLKNKTLTPFDSKKYGTVYFASIDGKSAFMNDQQIIVLLPDFIKTEDDFSLFLKYLNKFYSKGFEDGQNELKANLGNLLGFASKRTVDLKVDVLHNRLNDLPENLFRQA